MSSPSPRCLWCLGLLLCLTSAPSLALEGDRQQPIHLSADKAVRDEKQGTTVYSGNVVMSQGTLKIEADRITIYRIVEEAEKIVAEGRPAHLQQQPEPDTALVHAKADVIEYYKAEDRVHMHGNARIEQDGATVRGDSIDYFIEQQLVKADSAEGKQDNRVEVVIPASVTTGDAEGNSGTAESE